jgi:hypothetical protein
LVVVVVTHVGSADPACEALSACMTSQDATATDPNTMAALHWRSFATFMNPPWSDLEGMHGMGKELTVEVIAEYLNKRTGG